MAIVEVEISISVDGFVSGPNTDRFPGLGEGGDVLHAWLAEPEGQKIVAEVFGAAGSVLTSRAVYDGVAGWGDDPPYRMPVFVLTHRPHEMVVKGETTFTFVADGIEAAIAQAAAAAGAKKVHILGGASVIQQALNAGLVDQIHLHVAPILLAAGTPLFANLRRQIRLEPLDMVETSAARHLRYRVVK